MTVTHKWSGDGLSAGTLTTASAGVGDNAFDLVNGVVSIVATGVRSPQIDISTSGNYPRWNFTARTAAAYRGYVTTPSAWPTSNVFICRLRQSTTAIACSLGFNSAGTLRVFQTGGVQVGVSAITLSVSTTYRVEFIINHGNGSTTGTLTMRIYSLAGALLDTVTVTGANFVANHDNVIWGTDSNTTAMNSWQWDDLAVADVDTFIGDVTSATLGLQGRLAAFITALGSDIKALYSRTSDQAPFSRAGTLAVVTGTVKFPIMHNCTIDSVSALLGTAPTGSSAIIDVKKNGTTIYGTAGNRPTFAAASLVATVGAHSVTTLVAGDYLTVDIVQVGSTVAGADLGVSVLLRRTG